tara:strand:+ start:188 stop:448 length:261 start_codon:yes stop_codon:yes gene_type:complete
MIMYNKTTELTRKIISGISILVFILFLNFLLSCSSYKLAIEIPQHIVQRINSTEDTYMVSIQYLVWNDVTQEYEWEYYHDHHIKFQ